MSILSQFIFPVTEQSVRVQGNLLDPWFHLGDVCSILDIANTAQMADRIDDEYKQRINIGLPGSDPWFVNEHGLYDVILRSDKPVAKNFRKWVVEVIREIRLTGSYQATEEDQQHFEPFNIEINLNQVKANINNVLETTDHSDPASLRASAEYLNSLNSLLRHNKELKQAEEVKPAINLADLDPSEAKTLAWNAVIKVLDRRKGTYVYNRVDRWQQKQMNPVIFEAYGLRSATLTKSGFITLCEDMERAGLITFDRESMTITKK